MFELSIRVVAGAVLMVAAGVLGKPSFEFAGGVAVFLAMLGLAAYALERRSMRTRWANIGIASGDCLAVASVAAAANSLISAGVLVLIPCFAAARTHKISLQVLTPLAAASILTAANVIGPQTLSIWTFLQAGAVVAVGLLSQARNANSTELAKVNSLPVSHPISSEEVRESYRKLRDEFRSLERQSRHDRIVASIAEATTGFSGGGMMDRLAKRLKQVAGVDSTTLFSANAIGTTLHAEATSGDNWLQFESMSIDVDDALSDAVRKDRIHLSLQAVANEEHRSHRAPIFLKHGANLVGMLLLQDDDPKQLEEGERRMADAAPYIAAAIAEKHEKEIAARRLRESELLYMVAATARGAESKSSLAARVVRELQDMVDLDFAAVSLLEGGEEVPIVNQRGLRDFVESMSFAYGSGLAGWSKTGGHEVWIPDTSNDDRIARDIAVRSRIAGVAILPIRVEKTPSGVLIAASRRAGFMDESMIECLRIVCAEFAHALDALGRSPELPEGLATPSEFHAVLPNRPSGTILYIEPVRMDRLVDTFGHPATNHAIRQFAQRLRTFLPAGTLLCRRPEGDFVAHILGDADEALRWANEIAAQAAMIGIRTPDGKTRMPFAVRARIAELSAQNYQIVEEIAA